MLMVRTSQSIECFCRILSHTFTNKKPGLSFSSTTNSKMAEKLYPPRQDPHLIAGLVKTLESSNKKGPGTGKTTVRCKKSTFTVEGSDGISVDSWRFQDWDYKRRDLPTYARGLFTYHRKDNTPEIAIRGYDKFFNETEVPETQWENIKKTTRGPYELSVKENGCIIFISGLEGDKLLVCSKHSTGARQDADLSHAVAGERHLNTHLAAVGKTRADLARELRNRNATAVAELCDDSFEEHVLAYDQKRAGLYLHGINLNTIEFATYPGEQVHAFADEWGLKKAEYLIKDDVDAVKTFLEECAQTGSWSGRDTEGFVVRCQREVHANKGRFVDWFFKFKFEEPYLMYRQWREVTKAIIAGKPPRYKKHKKITEEYLLYARRQLHKDPSLGKAFQANHGIIAMRDGFLKERGVTGADIIRQQQEEGEDGSNNIERNIVLVPVASIGCGKTTVATALTKLFGWGHVQNDNITSKSNRPKEFASQIRNSLAIYPVVIADRNNHQKRERRQLMDDVQRQIPDARFVALHYVHDPKPQMLPLIRRVARERVLARGNNHQTIQAGSKPQKEIISIMDGFLDRFEPINPQEEPDDGFNNIINLEVGSSSHENLETVLSQLRLYYPKILPETPSPSDIKTAIQETLSDYQPDIKHDLNFKSNKGKNKGQNNQAQGSSSSKPPQVEYFCISVSANEISSKLEETFSSPPSERPIPEESSNFYSQLKQTGRLQTAFHVTLMHRASISQNIDLWSRLCSLHADSFKAGIPPAEAILGKCKVQLESVVSDRRVMCIVVRLLDEQWSTTNSVAHITLGTASNNIKPKESNTLLEKWLSVGKSGGIQDFKIPGNVILDGVVKAVLPGNG